MDALRATRNHYLAMAALGLGLTGLVALVNPLIAAPLALPVAFLVAQVAGAKFGTLAGRTLTFAEALRLAGLAALVHVGLGVVAILVGIAITEGQTVAIHYDRIALVLAAAAAVAIVVTLGGLWFGAKMVLRRKASGTD